MNICLFFNLQHFHALFLGKFWVKNETELNTFWFGEALSYLVTWDEFDSCFLLLTCWLLHAWIMTSLIYGIWNWMWKSRPNAVMERYSYFMARSETSWENVPQICMMNLLSEPDIRQNLTAITHTQICWVFSELSCHTGAVSKIVPSFPHSLLLSCMLCS